MVLGFYVNLSRLEIVSLKSLTIAQRLAFMIVFPWGKC